MVGRNSIKGREVAACKKCGHQKRYRNAIGVKDLKCSFWAGLKLRSLHKLPLLQKRTQSHLEVIHSSQSREVSSRASTLKRLVFENLLLFCAKECKNQQVIIRLLNCQDVP